jgi:glucose-1-phosphate thymidylyltransferase
MSELVGLLLAGSAPGGELSEIAGRSAVQALPVANRPLIAHALEAMRDCDIREVGVLVSPDTLGEMEALAGDGSEHGLQVGYIPDSARPGLVPALAAAASFVGERSVLVYRGDGLLTGPLAPAAEEFRRIGPDAMLLAVRPPRHAGGALAGRRLLHLVGDRTLPRSEHVLAGAHFFTAPVVEAATRLLAAGGRPTIAEALGVVLDEGGDIETRWVDGWWHCDGTVDRLLEANRIVLDTLETSLDDVDVSAAHIEGRASIHPTAVLERSTVRGPAAIGAGAVLLDTFVGPYTSIGDNVRLEGAEIQYSIVLPGATIRHPGGRLESSLVGPEATIGRDFALPAALRLRVGRRADVSLS